MLIFLLRRIALFVPTWLVISLLAFTLSRWAPGDPVLRYDQDNSIPVAGSDGAASDKEYRELARYLGLDRPAFYFSVLPLAYPDTLHHILRKDRRRAAKALLDRCGNWVAVQDFHRYLLQEHYRLTRSSQTLPAPLTGWAVDARRLLTENDWAKIDQTLRRWELRLGAENPAPGSGPEEAIRRWARIKNDRQPWRLYLPAFHWHGFDNQYHRWLTGVFRGDMGRSYVDGRAVSTRIGEAVRWTLLLNGLALLLTLLIAIPAGVFMARRQGTVADRSLNFFFFLGFAIPSFWLATLFLLFFTTPYYGMDWFPTLGPVAMRLPGEGWWASIWRLAGHLFLPVCSLSLGALAYLSRQVRSSMLSSLGSQSVLAARARGISRSKVVWKHAFRNALFPLITVLAGIFPALLSGSVVIEVIFNLYGMGMLTVQSILAGDWPTVFGILQISALLTMAGILISDLLYLWADPRVQFSEKNTGQP